MSPIFARLAFAAVALPIVISACGAPAGTAEAPTPDRVLATSDQMTIRDQDHIVNPTVLVPAGVDSAFKLLPQVYHELGIDTKYSNPLSKQSGNRDLTKYTRLGTTPLHEYLGCGTTMTGFSADNYRVQMSVLSTVRAEGTGSRIETALSARAEDPGASKGWLPCTSTGVLESKINNLLARKVKG